MPGKWGLQPTRLDHNNIEEVIHLTHPTSRVNLTKHAAWKYTGGQTDMETWLILSHWQGQVKVVVDN